MQLIPLCLQTNMFRQKVPKMRKPFFFNCFCGFFFVSDYYFEVDNTFVLFYVGCPWLIQINSTGHSRNFFAN